MKRSLVALALVACTSGVNGGGESVDGGPAPQADDASSAHDAAAGDAAANVDPRKPQGSWAELGTGVTYRRINVGPGVFIAYGGYTALAQYSQAWSEALWTARLSALGVGHLYAVKGPDDAGYGAREIANSALRAHMKGVIADKAPFILIGAHSSGAFVANEILDQLADADEDSTLDKIVYACLDGGGEGLETATVATLRRIVFVSAKDNTLAAGSSANEMAQMELGQEYALYGEWMQLLLPGSGCKSGAKWCLHDLLITHKPHNPDFYDLKDDYTDFVNRPVTTEWIDRLSSYLKAE